MFFLSSNSESLMIKYKLRITISQKHLEDRHCLWVPVRHLDRTHDQPTDLHQKLATSGSFKSGVNSVEI